MIITNIFGQGIDSDLTYDMRVTTKMLGLKGRVKSIEGVFESKFTRSGCYEENEIDYMFLPIFVSFGKSCTFDENGNVIHMEWCPPQWKNGFSADYTYDDQNRVVNVKIITLGKYYNEMNINFVYKDGRLVEKSLKNNTSNYVNFRKSYTTTYSYDEQKRLKTVDTKWFKSDKKGVLKEIDYYLIEYSYPQDNLIKIQKNITNNGIKSENVINNEELKRLLDSGVLDHLNNVEEIKLLADEEKYSDAKFLNEHGEVSKVYSSNKRDEYEYKYDKYGNWVIRRNYSIDDNYEIALKQRSVDLRTNVITRKITYYE